VSRILLAAAALLYAYALDASCLPLGSPGPPIGPADIATCHAQPRTCAGCHNRADRAPVSYQSWTP
jgi:hypothetical protein